MAALGNARNSGRALPGHLESAETVCPTFPGFVTFGAPTPLSKLKPPILVAQSGRYFRTLTLLLQILQDQIQGGAILVSGGFTLKQLEPAEVFAMARDAQGVLPWSRRNG